MLCPFHLGDVQFKLEAMQGMPAPIFVCPQCHGQVPALHVEGYKKYPPVVVSAIGFRQHGKTVYFASLFYALKKLPLASHWPQFFTMGLDEDSLKVVYDNMGMLEGGELPDATPKNFPRPTMVRIVGVPMQQSCTLLCYDTAGECFEKPTQLVQYASFVRRARTAMLLVSIPDLDDPQQEIHKLLNTYVVGMGELGAKSRGQHLVVAYTKADRLASRFAGSWIQRGLSPDLGATWLLPRVVGLDHALELLLTGDMIDAAEALRLGLVTKVVPHGEPMDVSLALARRLAEGPTIALDFVKRGIYRSLSNTLDEQLDFEVFAQNVCRTTQDHQEGVRSFIEKRPPVFRGR